MVTEVRTHLMFNGDAEAAMNFYVSALPQSAVREARRYTAGGNSGKLEYGSCTLAGREFICIDAPVTNDFSFSPAMSIFVDCESTSELTKIFETLSHNGEVLMPLDDYGFSRRFGWLRDRYGVSWQLNLA